MKTNRATTVAANTAAQTATMRPVPRSLSPASESRPGSCRPITRKTAFSSTKATVRQVIASVTRADAVCTRGERWARVSPVTTVARTPEACTSSAGRKAR